VKMKTGDVGVLEALMHDTRPGCEDVIEFLVDGPDYALFDPESQPLLDAARATYADEMDALRWSRIEEHFRQRRARGEWIKLVNDPTRCNPPSARLQDLAQRMNAEQ
jgi:hypothetical protein